MESLNSSCRVRKKNLRRKNDEQNNSKNRRGGCHNSGLSICCIYAHWFLIWFIPRVYVFAIGIHHDGSVISIWKLWESTGSCKYWCCYCHYLCGVDSFNVFRTDNECPIGELEWTSYSNIGLSARWSAVQLWFAGLWNDGSLHIFHRPFYESDFKSGQVAEILDDGTWCFLYQLSGICRQLRMNCHMMEQRGCCW